MQCVAHASTFNLAAPRYYRQRAACIQTGHGSVSVFQVGIGFSVYRSVFFQVGSVFVVGFQNIAILSVFHFASKRLDPDILLPRQSAVL